MKFVFIGAGNVANSLAPAIHSVESFEIVQIWSHTEYSASKLANRLSCAWTNDLSRVFPNADVYIYAVKDRVLADVVNQIQCENKSALHIHTAGSIGTEIFGHDKEHCAVMYPFQTFSRERQISMTGVPLFIEAKSKNDELLVKKIARQISGAIYDLNLDNRRWLHLAGVFTNNFTNASFAIAQELVAKANLPHEVLLPLMHETVDKLQSLTPVQAQTGPARRGDTHVMKQQQDLLTNPKYKQMYELMSEIIIEQKESAKKHIN